MDAAIESLDVSAFVIPTATPEADGTLEWDSTTLVLVELSGGGKRGIGYTYADVATARLVSDRLRAIVVGRDALDIPAAWSAMRRSIRNLGRPGISSMAIAAVDTALWDLKAKLLGVPLAKLFGASRASIPVYGSGGFTSYSIAELQQQFDGWAEAGIRMMKMKVGRDPIADIDRVHAAREAVGDEAELFVDANGAYDRKLALVQAHAFATFGVTWFEEPVSSDDLDGLRLLRGRCHAAGRHALRRLLRVPPRRRALRSAQRAAVGAHGADAARARLLLRRLREEMLFDGFRPPVGGAMSPDLSRPGLGIEFKRADARRFAVE